MPRIGPIKRRELIACLHRLSFEGPYSGGKHQFMVRGQITLRIPNPHAGDIGKELLTKLLHQAAISREEWELFEVDRYVKPFWRQWVPGVDLLLGQVATSRLPDVGPRLNAPADSRSACMPIMFQSVHMLRLTSALRASHERMNKL